ncbi:MAG: hypothetical protein A2711_06535 [Burkholderiales bacterium RIFCSPHIGHO2_01_FULL_63_240]|jgi:hypothetical protein|nr:MAG: hypothetical protein A2711_06535 [Burkholderiales bacterium RIFCSPHIGHO2_01_FULL_63_240]
MIIYMLYIGLVLGFAMDKSAGMGGAIILAGCFLALVTSVTTFVASKWLGSTASLGESIKGNIAALVAVWFSLRFGLQAVPKMPWVIFLVPVLAIGVATLVLEHMLSLSWPRALGVVTASGVLACGAVKVLLPAGVILLKGA